MNLTTDSPSIRTKGLLLAAGLGTRLRPLTDHTPKCLIPINGRPLLDYWVSRLKRAGIVEVLINSHHLHDKIVDYIRRLNRVGDIVVHDSFEPTLLGSAGTIHHNRDWMNNADECLIIYGDNLSSVDLRQLLAFHRSHEDPLTMMLFETDYPKQCGIAELDTKGRVVSFEEKPDKPVSNLANAGLYVASASAYAEIADMDKFDFAFDIIPQFVGRMRGWVFKGYHRDIGNLESLREAETDVCEIAEFQSEVWE